MRLEINVKLHSIIDQITNSSGTTYIFSDEECEEKAYEALKTIMTAVGLEDESVDDYFDISLVTTNRYNEIQEDYDTELKKHVVDYKIKITSKDNPNLDIAPLMDSLFKCFNTYQEGMFFGSKSIDWYKDERLQGLA